MPRLCGGRVAMNQAVGKPMTRQSSVASAVGKLEAECLGLGPHLLSAGVFGLQAGLKLSRIDLEQCDGRFGMNVPKDHILL